jgi:hypothetical protein
MIMLSNLHWLLGYVHNPVQPAAAITLHVTVPSYQKKTIVQSARYSMASAGFSP